MDLNKLISDVRAHPEAHRMGMVASHLGIVRGNALTGESVSGVEVAFYHDKIAEILIEIKKLNGIVDVKIDVCEGRLRVGEAIMAVVVGGDTRDNVFPALVTTVDRLKSEASRKKEF